jgi:hypothetical protein
MGYSVPDGSSGGIVLATLYPADRKSVCFHPKNSRTGEVKVSMKRCVCLLVSLAALSLLISACGNDSGQGTPVIDTVAPNPPVGFQFEDQGQGGTVKITWDSNAEADLAGYRLYRSSSENGPFGQVNSEPLLCPWYHDNVRPLEMTFYKATALDESGNESAFSQVFGVYSRPPDRARPETTRSE